MYSISIQSPRPNLRRLRRVARLAFGCSLAVFNLGIFACSGLGAEETCSSCDLLVRAEGQFAHHKSPSNTVIQGAEGNAEAFREEIYGKRFTLSVSHLPAGKYDLVIGECETHFNRPGQRMFDVSSGDTLLATNFDIVAAAGGAGKACSITGTVEHADDSINGPLVVDFVGRENNAKFNTFAIRDVAGATVVAFNASELADPFTATARRLPAVTGPELWKDPAQPLDDRVKDLVGRMSLAEKVGQIRNDAPAIPRLDIPGYDYWSECLHGVARAGVATVFPQAIGMAAAWDPGLTHAEADVISTEGRAKFHDYIRNHDGNSTRYHGLTFWTPNINIFRDPRWGRGQETYGEDPFLSGQLAVAFIRGLEGDNPDYVKAMACAKHYDVHSGPEPARHAMNVDPSPRDFYETYLPQFEMAVREGRVGGVMGAYNAVYGKPACASPLLLTDILRRRWGFEGYIVSDCGAIRDIWANHHYVATPEEAAAAAVKAGCDICCGRDYQALLKAVQTGLISEDEVDQAVFYALKSRFRLGLFDPPSRVPWANIGLDQNDTPAHEALALKVAEESIVLLKNDGVLPLNPTRIKRIAVIGPNADSVPVLLGNYSGTPARPVTILAGIREIAGSDIEVTYAQGCPIVLRRDGSHQPGTEMLADALTKAKAADAVVFVGGITTEYEREESSRPNAYVGFHGGDRTRIELPTVQEELLKALEAVGKPVVLVNCSGSAMAMPWEAEHLSAILQAWYPGEQGGNAVAKVLFGDVNPSGRLPVTFYRSTGDLPPFDDYSMSNRTYRYFTGKPLYAFGHGLSYTTFRYRRLRLSTPSARPEETVNVTLTVRNTGKRDGDEVVQIYATARKPPVPMPLRQLVGFARVSLKARETRTVEIEMPLSRLRRWDEASQRYLVDPGAYQIVAGPSSDRPLLRTTLRVGE